MTVLVCVLEVGVLCSVFNFEKFGQKRWCATLHINLVTLGTLLYFCVGTIVRAIVICLMVKVVLWIVVRPLASSFLIIHLSPAIHPVPCSLHRCLSSFCS